MARVPRCCSIFVLSPQQAQNSDASGFVAPSGALMQVARERATLLMPPAGISAADTLGRLIKLLCALWLAGVALRMTILAMPPVIPLVHDELHMSETQVGLLIGLPLAIFALAAVPGSLLTARLGAKRAVIAGMTFAAFAGGARGAAINVATLYAATVATGFGIAIMQPSMPALVREWLPHRITLGTTAYSAGMLLGASFAPILTIPFVLPLLGGSWRLDLMVWAIPAILIVPVFFLLSPKTPDRQTAATATGGRWWPDFKNPLVWLLGLTFGSNNSPYFTTNAFLGDYLASSGQMHLLAPALGWLNGFQVVALVILFSLADRLQRRAWPFLVFGPMLLGAFLVMMFIPTTIGIVGSAGMIGITTAFTLTVILALPPLLAAPADVPRTAAGMFTISYTCAIIIPTISGALWDLTGKPWTVFVPLCVCAVTMTVLGTVVTRYPAASEKGIIAR
jgi:MFS transporter, CP family, cyanate transporter